MLNEVSDGDMEVRIQTECFFLGSSASPSLLTGHGPAPGSRAELEQAAPSHEGEMGMEELAWLQRGLHSPSSRY